MVWSYNNTILGAYMDLYHFLTFVLKAKFKNIVILTDIKKCPLTHAQISAAYKVFDAKLELNRYLDIYKEYIFYPQSKDEIIQLLNSYQDWKLFYFNGHASQNILGTPFGNIDANFIYHHQWTNLILIFDCCQPPTYNLPYVWSKTGQLIRANIINTIYNTYLQDKILIVISSHPEKFQYSDIYGSNFTKNITHLILTSNDILNDKMKCLPDYFISSNIKLDHQIIVKLLFHH